MKKQLIIFLLSIVAGLVAYQGLFPSTAIPKESVPTLATVPEVNVERYMGTWHEVASIPMVFQKDCAKNTQAHYHLNTDGTINVRNRCETEAGKTITAKGLAWATNTENTQLKVTFVNLVGWWVKPFSGDYWIIGLDPDYRWAVVGHPQLKYGWILARNPLLEANTLKHIAQLLEEQGYNSCEFRLSAQDKGLTQPLAGRPLCQHLGQSPWGLKPAQPKETNSTSTPKPEDAFMH